MKRLLVTVAAALALGATQVSAQGGGGAAGGAGAGAGESGGASSGTSGTGASVSGAARDRADQNAAAQEAPSVTGTEGAGGKRPQPQAQDQGGERRFGEAPAQQSGPEGRPATQTPGQATTASPAQPGAAAPGQPSEVSGRVALVSPNDNEIAIDAGTSTTQVKVAPDAQITVNGKRSSLKDIHQGAQVRASLQQGDDGLQAKRVEVTSAAKSYGNGK